MTRALRPTRVCSHIHWRRGWIPFFFVRAMKAKVLIVDDDSAVRQSLSKVLRGEGYEVFQAADGREAVECHDPEQLDLLLLDLSLPFRDGWDTFERLTD